MPIWSAAATTRRNVPKEAWKWRRGGGGDTGESRGIGAGREEKAEKIGRFRKELFKRKR
jgi:hypothetical protein